MEGFINPHATRHYSLCNQDVQVPEAKTPKQFQKAERFNQVLLAILRILPEERKKYIPKIENTYNTTAVDANQQVTPPVPILHFLGAIIPFAN